MSTTSRKKQVTIADLAKDVVRDLYKLARSVAEANKAKNNFTRMETKAKAALEELVAKTGITTFTVDNFIDPTKADAKPQQLSVTYGVGETEYIDAAVVREAMTDEEFMKLVKITKADAAKVLPGNVILAATKVKKAEKPSISVAVVK